MSTGRIKRFDDFGLPEKRPEPVMEVEEELEEETVEVDPKEEFLSGKIEELIGAGYGEMKAKLAANAMAFAKFNEQ